MCVRCSSQGEERIHSLFFHLSLNKHVPSIQNVQRNSKARTQFLRSSQWKERWADYRPLRRAHAGAGVREIVQEGTGNATEAL